MTVSKAWAETDGAGRDSTVWGISGWKGQFVAFLGAIFLMVAAPAFVIFVCVVHTLFSGSVLSFFDLIRQKGWIHVLQFYPKPTFEAWTAIAVFGVIQALFQLLLPGKIVKGPITPSGHTPLYKANGLQSFLSTLFLFTLGWYCDWFHPSAVYDRIGEILASLNLFAFGLCAFLYIKGHLFPSTLDSGSTGNLVYDFYWGTELYPRIGKWFDIKTWTNCRMGMMGWSILILCYVAKQYELYGEISDSIIVSVILMELYIFKFFLWEAGYWCSMDIAHDRAGYYLCWGCLNWVPGIYTSPAMYLVKNPIHLGAPKAIALLLCGMLCILINYDADRQRQEFRKREGKIKIWGKAPIMIQAEYKTRTGAQKKSLLLASGWWGIARHFHYVPEILGAFFWTIPVHFGESLQFFYVFFLTLLLLDRAYRDDVRCRSKYGKYWDAYCDLVPYKLVPGIF